MCPHPFPGVASTVKKFRFSEDYARKLRRIAKHEGVTESDVVRRGIDLQQRVIDRRKAVEGLIAMIDGPEPKKLRFRLK